MATRWRIVPPDPNGFPTTSACGAGRGLAVVGVAAAAACVIAVVAMASRDEGGAAGVDQSGPSVVAQQGGTLGSVPGTIGPLGSPRAGPVAIEGIQELDPPPGDGRENPGALVALTDGDPTTAWTTVCYQSKYLYPKSGIGLVLGLSGSAKGQQLRIAWPSAPWRVSVYTGDSPGADLDSWGEPIAGRGSDQPGEAVFSLGTSEGRYVLVWLTQLAKSDACSTNPYRGAIAELTVEPAG